MMAEKIGSLEFDIIGIDNISDVVEASKAKIQGLVDSTVKGSTKMDESFNKIKDEFKKAFGQVDTVIDTNIAEIKKLEAEYTKLSSEAGKAFQSGKDDDYRRIQARQEVLKSEIATRKQLVSEASKSNTELASLEDKVAAKVKVNAGAQKQLRTQLMLAREELAKMEAAGQRGTAAYEKLQVATAKMTDQYKDATRQANILANDERGFQGIIQGLGGVSGAMSAAAGAYGLFAGENENLQKIMTKVQSLMAITIGLQQIAQTVNKDSAFMLVTVNGLKKWWNEITGKSVVVQTAEAVATKAATAAKKGQTGEIVKGTAATAGNTAATATGTVATKGLAGGFKAVGLAIKSIPGIGWLIAGITAVVAAFALLTKKTREAKQEQIEFNKKVAESVAEPITNFNKLSLQFKSLGNDMKAKEKFVKDNAKAFEELGVSVNNVADAENLLIKNTQAFINSQIAKAKANIYMQQAQEKMKEAMELRSKEELSEQTKDLVEGSAFEYSIGGKMYQGIVKGVNATKDFINKKRLEQASDLDKEINNLCKKAINAEAEAAKELEKTGVNTAEKYAEGSLKALQEALSAKNEMFEKSTSGEERQRLKKEIDAVQKQIDKIDIRRSKTTSEEPFLDKIQKQKAVYDQVAKDLNSTDEEVVASGQKKYDELKKQGDTYLDYLKNQRAKILESEKKLTPKQQSNLDVLNTEISDLTQKKAEEKAKSQAQKLIDEYGKTFDKRLQLQEEYNRDVAILEKERESVVDESELQLINKALENRKRKYESDIDALYSILENKYKSYEERRLAVQEQYAQERKLMEEKNALDLEIGKIQTYTEDKFKASLEAEKEAMQAINDEEIKMLMEKSELMKKLFKDYASLTKKEIKDTIKETKTLLDFIKGYTTEAPKGVDDKVISELKSDPEQLANLYQQLSALEELDRDAADYKFGGFVRAFDDMKAAAEKSSEAMKQTGVVKDELDKETEQLEKRSFKGLMSGASDFSETLSKASGYMREIAYITNNIQLEKSADIMDGVVTTLEAVVGGASSGGVWGAIIAGFLSVISGSVTGILKREAEVEKNIADFKSEQIESEKQINLLMVERLKIQAEADTAFLNEIAKRIEGYQKAAAAAKDGLNALYAQTEYDWGGDEFKGLEAIKWLMVRSITKKTQEGNVVQQNLASYDIWNADMTGFDAKKLEAFILKLGEADKDLKVYLMSILKLQKEYDDAVQAAADALTSSFDNLGSSAIDAITQSIENGTNAWGAFKESAADALKDVVANMLYTVYMSSKMEELKKNLESIAKGTYATEEDRANAIANYFGTWLEEAKPGFDALMTATRGMYTKIDETFGSAGGGGITTLSGAIKGASQESIDLLAGQTNAVRLNQVEALSLSRSQLFRLVSIDSGVQQIIQIMNANKGNNQIQTDPLRAKGVTTL